MWRLLLLVLVAAADDTVDDETSRKVLGSSVVTSVSVIMDAGNGSKIYADAVGKPMTKPSAASDVASPINLLNPDRYEFYTFDDTGDLVKRLMTLKEIKEIVATGDGDGFSDDLFTSNGFIPEKRVNDVVNNVQNVLKEEIKTHKEPIKPQLDTPDVSDSWSMILPAIFGNSGEDIKPEPPITHVTPDTIMIEPTVNNEQISTTEKLQTLQTQKTPLQKLTTTTTTTTTKAPMINVEIITNSNSTTEKTINIDKTDNSPLVEIKPIHNDDPTKDNIQPIYYVQNKKSTKRPQPVKVTTFRPTRSTTPRPRTTTTSAMSSTTSATTSTTSQLENDVAGQASTTIFEKIVPPQAFTKTQYSTTENIKVIPEISTLLTTLQTESETLLPTTTEKLITTSKESILSTTQFQETTTADLVSTSESTTDDLSTLSTEYVAVKTVTPPNSTYFTTTESQTSDRTTSNALDQLLLTSTNIYEINSQLSQGGQSTLSDDSIETTTAEDLQTTEKFLIKISNPTEVPETVSTTTDQAFINTIEQLISQAVNSQSTPTVSSEKEAAKVEEMISKSGNKTMNEVAEEAATVASQLIGNNDDLTSTTEFSTTVTTEGTTLSNEANILSESVGSLLSQVYGQGSTTVEYDTTTNLPDSTTTMSRTTFIPHIINITIIKNEDKWNLTKPAKSDLSLEMDYDAMLEEMNKNVSLATRLKGEDVQSEISTTSVEPTALITTQAIKSTTEYSTTISSTSTSSTTSGTTIGSSNDATLATNSSNSQEDTWTLVSTLSPPSETKPDKIPDVSPEHVISTIIEPPPVDLVPKPLQGFGLEDSTAKLDSDIYQFVQLCNELAFGFWKSVTTGISSARSVVVSPFAATSLLAMVFLGARGSTSGEMNEILKLDDMVTFNPHLIFKNVSESIETNPDSGVAISTIVRQLYSDRSKGKLLGFYKERVRQFYDGLVEEASFKEIGDVIRRRTNLLVKKNTDGKISDFLKDGSIIPKPPLAGVSISIFETDCSQGSTEGRDGELHFVVLPSIRQRRLVPIPATVYRTGFLAGYEPSLDATAAALGTKDQIISTIFIIPGQQGMTAPGDGLARLEKRLVESSFKKGAWARLLRSLIPRPGLELQIPRFQHRSLINSTQALKRMGLHDLFDVNKADLKGLNGAAHELHLSDVLQINEFATCGERRIGEAHHKEVYPATTERRSRLLLEEWEEPRDYQRAFHDPLHDPSYLSLPLPLRPRQARVPETPRLRFDRPFLYFVRHNPSGLILHMGRFHPRLLP